MDRPSPLDNINVPKELVLEFFAVFSRFEHALKSRGFVFNDRHDNALVDWGKFIREATPWFENPREDVAESVNYLVNEPPYRQVMQHQSIEWERRNYPAGTPNAALILEAVKTVRNNLFHGGKHAPHSPAGRDERLIRSCLDVLYHCLDRDDSLNSEYLHWLY